jgi:hypothetical protein
MGPKIPCPDYLSWNIYLPSAVTQIKKKRFSDQFHFIQKPAGLSGGLMSQSECHCEAFRPRQSLYDNMVDIQNRQFPIAIYIASV